MPENQRRILNIAHRGASAYAPENTAEAFEEAISRNADMIEFDLRKTSDGRIILHHDSHILDNSYIRRPVSRMTYSEISELSERAGSRLAAFDEILGDFGDRIAMNIEIKVGGFEREVIAALKADPPAFEPVISSFKPNIIRRIKTLDPSMKVGLVVGEKFAGAIKHLTKPLIGRLFSGVEYDNFHLHKDLAYQDVIDGLLDSGFSVYIWTVNNPQEIGKLIAAGVTGIISDFPDLVHDIRENKIGELQPITNKLLGG